MLALLGFLWAFSNLCYTNPIPPLGQRLFSQKSCRQHSPVRVRLKAVVGVMVSESCVDLEHIKAGAAAIAQVGKLGNVERTRRARSG